VQEGERGHHRRGAVVAGGAGRLQLGLHLGESNLDLVGLQWQLTGANDWKNALKSNNRNNLWIQTAQRLFHYRAIFMG
jgi:hypothetical protein